MALNGHSTSQEQEAHWQFYLAARYQRICARCNRRGFFEAHHVIEAQFLRRSGLPVYDPRNALRLCHACHSRHTNRYDPLPLSCLTDENFEYAFEILGPRAIGYLEAKYVGEDARLREATCSKT